jgi:hypothetical protein
MKEKSKLLHPITAQQNPCQNSQQEKYHVDLMLCYINAGVPAAHEIVDYQDAWWR